MPTAVSNHRGDPAEGMGELGAQLRALREAQHQTYEDVTRAIHVRPFVLQAIEEGRILEEVDAVYARGFVKNYCEYLYADDLWKKYKDLFGMPADHVSVRSQGAPSLSGINHPTPIFRRASTLWIYLILILAVAGAGYLLWWQQKEGGTGGFSGLLMQNNTAAQGDVPRETAEPDGGAASSHAAQSPDLPMVVHPASPDTPVSVSQTISADTAAPPIDLSWMDGSMPPVGRSDEAARAVARSDTGNRLVIEITGERCWLEILQNGEVLTSRTLQRGESRSYDVTSDIEARFGNGSAAKIVWKGTVYESVGDGGSPVRFHFTPSGEMKLLRGRSRYGQ